MEQAEKVKGDYDVAKKAYELTHPPAPKVSQIQNGLTGSLTAYLQEPAAKKTKKEKDPNAPKRKPTAYNIFVQDKRAEILVGSKQGYTRPKLKQA